jgi:hypothetical protein
VFLKELLKCVWTDHVALFRWELCSPLRINQCAVVRDWIERNPAGVRLAVDGKKVTIPMPGSSRPAGCFGQQIELEWANGIKPAHSLDRFNK